MKIRPAIAGDREALAEMFFALRQDQTLDEHAHEIDTIFAGTFASTLPYALFVAETDGDVTNEVIGFAEVGMRSHAEGCDSARPAGFVEGWFVKAAHRKKSVGALLMRVAEEWARAQGCTEMGSDTWHDNDLSIAAHQALGFEIADRLVAFRKSLI
ncbi:MAG: GNAT family N-acetyltransferase [Polyangiaceae bacterium]